MNKKIHLYGLLLVFTLIQIVCMKFTPWFPDLMILIVVFAGIFQGYTEGIRMGFVAGIIRGSLSVYTLPLDVFLFPAVGAASAALARRFYRQNPVVEVIITIVAVFMIIAFHTLYLRIVSGNDFLGLWNIFTGSARAIAVTVAVSPLLFFMLRGLREQEE
ncbi:MAG: rod shape-determining protein MreD [Candidatus Omnitrophota bacterium]